MNKLVGILLILTGVILYITTSDDNLVAGLIGGIFFGVGVCETAK